MMTLRTMLIGGGVVFAAGAAAIAGSSWVQPSPVATPVTVQTATAEVTRGALLDTKTVTGTLGYGELNALRPSLADSAAMVTWIAPVGATVKRGEPLYALDGQPTILFYGSVQQHRTLRFDPHAPSPIWIEFDQAETALVGAELALQLEQARLTDAATRAADARIRLDDALSTAPALPEFIQLAGSVTAAKAKVDRIRELSAAELAPAVEVAAAESELAATRAALDAASRTLRKEVAAAELDTAAARVAVAEAEIRLDELRIARNALAARAQDDADVQMIAANLAALGYRGPLADQVRAWQSAAGLPVTGIVGPSHLVVAPGPAHIAAHSASIGETLLAASSDRGSVLDYSGIDKLVTVPLSVSDRGLATMDGHVIVTLPDESEVEGRISEVGSVVTDGAIEVTVTIADQATLGALEVASVDVQFVSDSRDGVLSVPVAALLARPEGGFAVEVVTGATSALVPVDTGLFAAGRVEIRGDGIAEGLRVGVPG